MKTNGILPKSIIKHNFDLVFQPSEGVEGGEADSQVCWTKNAQLK